MAAARGCGGRGSSAPVIPRKSARVLTVAQDSGLREYPPGIGQERRDAQSALELIFESALDVAWVRRPYFDLQRKTPRFYGAEIGPFV